MRISPETVAVEHEWVHDRVDVVVPLINVVRNRLGPKFGTTVDGVTTASYHEAVDAVFADGDRAVNATALIRLLRDLDVDDDYPGFVVDELLGRELAAIIAGDQPLRLLAEATFHYADVLLSEHANRPGENALEGLDGEHALEGLEGDEEGPGGRDEVAGTDDLDAALAAGFQTRLPGWQWREQPSPFRIE